MLTQLYQTLMGYSLGGTVAVILFILMYRKSSSVASSGNKARMATVSIAPALLVIVSILAATAAFNFAVPRLQSAVTSAPVQGAVQAGGVAVQAIDYLLAAPAANTGGMVNVGMPQLDFSSSVQQPIVPSGGWLGGSLNSVAPGTMAKPALEPENSEPTDIVKIRPTQASLFTFPTVAPVQQQVISTADRTGEYVVQRGDSLFKIAQRVYGDGELWTAICNANSGTLRGNCGDIRSGQRLVIPEPNTANRAAPSAPANVQHASATVRQNGQAFTAQGQQYINALNTAQEAAVKAQNGQAWTAGGQQHIDALNAAQAQPTATPKPKLVFFSTAIPGVAPTPHEFATNPYFP